MLREAAADAAAVIFQHPNFFGCLEPAPDLAVAAADAGAMPVAHVDLISLGVLEAPGNYGCAMAIGEGQSAGNPMSYGGPHYGFLAARQEYIRRLPGRIVGETVDAAGDRGYVLDPPDARAAHPAREGDLEHHHEPDAPCAGRAGAPEPARPGGAPGDGGDLPRTRRSTRRSGSSTQGSSLCFRSGQRSRSLPFAPDGAPPTRSVARAARGVYPGYPVGRDYAGMDDALLVAVTERRTVQEIDRLVEALAR